MRAIRAAFAMSFGERAITMLLAIFAGWAFGPALGFSGTARFGLCGRTMMRVGILDGFGVGRAGSRFLSPVSVTL
jgi:hypothetical protein